MAPLVPRISGKKEDHTVKKVTVGKLTAEMRKKVPDPKTIVNNYYVNKAKQVNKIVIKNKTAAPLNIETHSNDVYMSYSPAVFKEAVNVLIDTMKEGTTFETERLNINVTKVMQSTDLMNIKTQDLITLEIQSKKTLEKPVKLQLHIYYTNQAIMIQGHRKVNGVKGYKLFFEDFFHPYIELLVQTKKEEIDKTRIFLDKSGEKKTPENVVEQKQVKEQVKELDTATDVAKEIIDEMLNDTSSRKTEIITHSHDCPKCEGKFLTEPMMKEHVKRVHTDKTFMCQACGIEVNSYRAMSVHIEENHDMSAGIDCNQIMRK